MIRFNFGTVKLLRIGDSFYTSVPITWVRNLKLGKGQRIHRFMDEKGRLVVSPAERKS